MREGCDARFHRRAKGPRRLRAPFEVGWLHHWRVSGLIGKPAARFDLPMLLKQLPYIFHRASSQKAGQGAPL